MSQSRPKPWETGTLAAASVSATSLANNTTTATSTSTTSDSPSPTVPPVPGSITNTSNPTNTNTFNTNGYSTSTSYGSGYGSNMYGSGYGSYNGGYGINNYGGLGGMSRYGGSLGGYSNYGGYSGIGGYGMAGMGGMGAHGMGAMGMNGINSINDPGSFADATSRTFQVLENVVYAVSAVAALLESTYFATYNSFFTILGVADQLGHIGGGVGGALKTTVTGVTDSVNLIRNGASNENTSPNGPLGLFALFAWLKRLLKRLLGFSTRSDNSSALSLLNEFYAWKNGIQSTEKSPAKHKNSLSLKPLLVFLVALVGLPVVMSKFIKYIEKHNQRLQGVNASISHVAINPTTSSSFQNKLDPKSLEFARAVYDYIPEREDEQSNGWKELKLLRGNLVAILNNVDGWSNCRTRDGRVGYVPTSYLEIIKKGGKKNTPAQELEKGN